jgi:DNA-binding MarR family transcriptional regulator
MSDELQGPPPLHAALVKHTGFLISRMGMIAQRQFSARIATVGLNPRMWGTLNVLDAEGEITQHQLGRSVGIDPSSMVSTIDELEQQGLVERRPHPTDRRAYAIHITTRGREVLAEARKLAAGAQDELLGPLNASERELLHALLLRLVVASS